MNQIFLFLASLANLALAVTFVLGWRIDDPASLEDAARHQVAVHFLFALAASFFVLLVHAVVLTYFMGTGRWIEETSEAYGFDPAARRENVRLKYRVVPGMVACMALVIVTGAFGAIADPGSNVQWEWASMVHGTLALSTLCLNVLVSLIEARQIGRNTALVNLVYEEVQSVRRERGLDPQSAAAARAVATAEDDL